jgi:hypothetical protein
MRELQQGAGRVETANPERSCGSPLDPNLAPSVLDARDVIQRNRQPLRSVAGEECVEVRDLELSHVSWAVALVPPDGIAASLHEQTVPLYGCACIRIGQQRPCGKPVIHLWQRPDGGDARPEDT